MITPQIAFDIIRLPLEFLSTVTDIMKTLDLFT